jgi:hypothetical protein
MYRRGKHGEHGNQIHSTDEIYSRWKEHLETILNSTILRDPTLLSGFPVFATVTSPPHLCSEIEAAIKDMIANKTASLTEYSQNFWRSTANPSFSDITKSPQLAGKQVTSPQHGAKPFCLDKEGSKGICDNF